jgi:hypothetical protein
MQGELTRHDAVFSDGVVEERFEQRSGFRVGDVPADDPAAKNIYSDVEIKMVSSPCMPISVPR